MGHVQGIDGPRHHGVDLGLREGFGLRVGVALELQRVRVVLQAGQQRAGEVQVPQHVAALQQLPHGRVGAPGRRVRQGHWHQGRRDGRVCLRRRVVRRQVDACYGGGNLSIHLRGSVVLQQGRGDCCACFCCSAVGRQRRCNGRISLCCCFVRHQRGCYRCVCLRNAVRVARQAQGEVVVLETHAEGCVEVQVAESVGAQQQVPGDLARPGLGVDQAAATAGGQGRQLREDGVYSALQAGFGGSQVGGRGKGVCRLQGQDVCVVAVQPAVPERQRGVQSRLLDARQQRRSDGACHLSRGLVARRLQGSHGGFGRVQPAVPHRQQGVDPRGVSVRQQCRRDGAGELRRRLEARRLQGRYGRLGRVEPAVSQGQGRVQSDLGHIR